MVITTSVAATAGAAGVDLVVWAGALGVVDGFAVVCAGFAGVVDLGFAGVVCAAATVEINSITVAVLRVIFTGTKSPGNDSM
jgi:hypothetical protein